MEIQCSKNHFKMFLPQEAGVFGNNIEKEPQKPRAKLYKYVYYTFTENICCTCKPMQVAVFFQKCIKCLDVGDNYFGDQTFTLQGSRVTSHPLPLFPFEIKYKFILSKCGCLHKCICVCCSVWSHVKVGISYC